MKKSCSDNLIPRTGKYIVYDIVKSRGGDPPTERELEAVLVFLLTPDRVIDDDSEIKLD